MNITTANRLVQYRKQRGMSQEELAAELGLSRQAVSKWERAEASPDTDNLIALARLYGVSLDTLLLSDQPPAPAPAPTTEPVQFAPPPQPHVEEAAPAPDAESGGEQDPPAPDARQRLSPGARRVLWLGGVLVWVAFSVVFGLVSLLFPVIRAAYAPLCTLVYLTLGFGFGRWHPDWMIFLSIPIFDGFLG